MKRDGSEYSWAEKWSSVAILVFVVFALIWVALVVDGKQSSAQTQAPAQRCVWTYIKQTDIEPSIGKDGQVQLRGTWQKLSEEGWTLKTATVLPPYGAGIFIFERCQ